MPHHITQYTALALVSLSGTLMADSRTPDQASTRDLILAVSAATESIQTAEGNYKIYFPSLNGQGAIKGEGGQDLYAEYFWRWDRSDRRELLDGRWGFSHKGKVYYQDATFAFDGRRLKAMNRTGKSGKISEVGSTFLNWRSPLILVGLEFAYMPTRDLKDLIRNAVEFTDPEAPPNVRCLEADFLEGLEPEVLRVWIDTKRGYIPVKIESRRKMANIRTRTIINDQIEELQPGVWMPTKGSLSFYTGVLASLPEGYTPGMLKSLSKEEAMKIADKVKFKEMKIGLGTETYVVDRKSLKINDSADVDDQFTFDFPPGCLVWDDFSQKSYRTPDVAQPENVWVRLKWWLLLPLVMIAGLAFWRLKSRSPRPNTL